MNANQIRRARYSIDGEGPSPAAVAAATAITEAEFRDVYLFAAILDDIAREARDNERARIFAMSFWEIMREFWKGKRLYAPDSH